MESETITWTAPEHDYREHTPDWYWAVGILIVALSIAFVIVGNILLSIIIILGVGMLLVHAKRKPPILDGELSEYGIRFGRLSFRWDSLESFSILDLPLEKNGPSNYKLVLVSNKKFTPYIMIPLGDKPPHEDIVTALQHMLPEEEHPEPIPHRLMRLMGF